MKNIKLAFLLLIIVSVFGCKEDFVDELNLPDFTKSEYLYEVMIKNKWYFWVDEVYYKIPNPDQSFTSSEYLDKVINKPLDRFSFVTTISEFDAYFSSGESLMFGFEFDYDGSEKFRITMVVHDSPADRAGIKRGYILKSVNNFSVSIYSRIWYDQIESDKIDFILLDYDNKEISATMEREVVSEKAVHYSNTYDIDGVKIGYFVFNSFIQPAFDELDDLFEGYKNQNVTKMIVDLRYNGGGQVNVAAYLGSLLAGKIAHGKVFEKTMYNKYKSERDDSSLFYEMNNSLLLDEIVFITTRSSASASEMLINGIKPFMPIRIIGDTTYGKPVGMRTFRYKDMVAAFITFTGVNANGEGDYYDGIPVDAETRDGIDKDFGDTEEACLKQALYYFKNNSFNYALKSFAISSKPRLSYEEYLKKNRIF